MALTIRLKMRPRHRVIVIPAINRSIPLGIYVQGVKAAIAAPQHEFKHGLTTWWPTTGAEIHRQFRASIHDRINQGISYSQRGIAK